MHGSLPGVRAAAMLAHADLPALPSGADTVKHCRWWCPDQADEYVRFAAEPNAAEAFVRETTAAYETAGEITADSDAPAWYADDWARLSRRHAFRSFDDRGIVTLHLATGEAGVVLIHRRWMLLPPSERKPSNRR
jgi:hypothetical protein